MITTLLKAAALSAGCDQVFYESKQLANIITDQALQGNVFCLIIQPDSIKGEVKGNGIRDHFQAHIIEVMQQTKLEDTAENNEVVYAALWEVCKKIVWALIETQAFNKIKSFNGTKIPETRYDFNPIGWSISLDLTPIVNSDQC
jgi:hypothetical protein